MTAVTVAIAIAVAGAGGYALGAGSGLLVGAGAGLVAVWRPRVVAQVAAGLVAAAAVSTVVEAPLTRDAITTFPLRRELAAELGRVAGIVTLAAVAASLGWARRPQAAVASVVARERVSPTLRAVATGALALAAAAGVLATTGDRTYAGAAGPLWAGSALLGGIGLWYRILPHRAATPNADEGDADSGEDCAVG